MPIPVNCPGCSVKLKAADTAAGKRIKCPKCQAPIDVPAAAALAAVVPVTPAPPPTPPKPRVTLVVQTPKPVPAPPPVIVKAAEYEVIALPEPPPPPAVPTRELKACAFCGEDVLAVAKKCKHCGETIDVALRAAEEAMREARRDRGRDRGGNQTTQVVVGGGYYKAPFNHAPHIILDILTLGFWLPIHIICWVCH